MKAIVIINEQHTILKEQLNILNEKFESFEYHKIPATGITIKEQIELANELSLKDDGVVFVSPIPVLLAECASLKPVYVFANDKREKKELPNGKIISVTAQTGWELVEC